MAEAVMEYLPAKARCTTSSQSRSSTLDFHRTRKKGYADWCVREKTKPESAVALLEDLSAELGTQEKFRKLAAEWSESVRSVSSLTAITSHAKYREIVSLGWDVVPYLLRDLQRTRRFWFPALAEITTIRPYDPRDAGNTKRMTDAWLKWGKLKRLI